MSEGLVFSFLLVVRNEEKYIADLLEAILNQDFPQDLYEIIVVDGESTDRTLEIVKEYCRRNPERIQLLHNPQKTLPPGWNIGIRQARGQYVIRVDGHSKIPRDFLSRNYAVAQRVPEAACVGGVIHSVGLGFWGEVNAYVYSHPFGVGNSKFRTQKEEWEGFVDTVPYGAYKKEVFEQVGLFDETLKRNEDLEMHARIRQNGGKFFLSTSISSTYYVRSTLLALIKKSFADGKWTTIAARRGKAVLRFRHLIPFYTVLTGGILALGSLFFPLLGMILLILSGLYMALIFISAAGIIRHKGWCYFFPCILSFICLHFSRGIGSMAGFFNREYWRKTR